MPKFILSFIITAFSVTTYAQPTTGEALKTSWEQRNAMEQSSLLKDYPVRNVGPTIQGGRIVDIEVNNKNTTEFYVGYASGGIFKTVNNGITFEPIFDNHDAMGVGDFALSQSDPKIIYVGTGEKNSSRSSYAGSGVYKTTDGGTTWKSLGLENTHHISRVLIHPTDNNIVWIAAIGPLYTPSSHRGVYLTTDGGATWSKTLFVNDSTGVIDIAVNPQNPSELYASSWERTRRSWQFTGSGSGSAIYKSTDGGRTWKKSVTGFPSGTHVGRIGLDISPKNPNVVYAILDNQLEVEDKKAKKVTDKLRTTDLRTMTKEDFLKLEDSRLESFLRDNGYPKKYTAEIVKKDVRENNYTVKDIADYFGGDANNNLFDTKVTGAELYRSEDSGASWKKMNGYDLDGVFYTYGYYFAEMEISADNPDLIYIYGVPLLKSLDAGASWHRIDTLDGVNDIHVDHHVVWSNPSNSKHLLLGNDGGLYQSYDEGANWIHINNMSVGQFYTVNYDMETPYNIYGGLQDNGVLKGSSKSVPNISKHWESIFGGDGMYVAPDPRNSNVVYTGFQFGNYYRIENKKSTGITPQHNIGQPAYRWNWRTPLFLSKHNPDIVYMAANKVFRSLNKGESFEVISDDLTKNRKQGNVPFSSISAMTESPMKFGLLYVGTDDGNVWVTKDGGGNWTSITSTLPANKWVSSITASSHEEGTVFISLNGYRDDDFKTYLYISTDYGTTWRPVKGNLPESVANVIIQDPVNPDLLYCGLDNGTYVSLDKGATWEVFTGMLNVASYDMTVHPRDNELMVATHGRSIFVADVKPLQQLKNGGQSKAITAFEPESIRHSERWGEKTYEWDKPSKPTVRLFYYSGVQTPAIKIEVLDEKKNVVRTMNAPGGKGFHQFTWDAKIELPAPEKGKKGKNPPVAQSSYVAKGKYTIRFTNGSEKSEVTLEVK